MQLVLRIHLKGVMKNFDFFPFHFGSYILLFKYNQYAFTMIRYIEAWIGHNFSQIIRKICFQLNQKIFLDFYEDYQS